MPKFEPQGAFKKLNLAQIVESGNVRENYADIAELAASIKVHGQLQPVLVKARGKNADGVDEYELVAGHRRVRAFQILCDAGDDFSRIDAMAVAGDKLTLQLIENLQRSDLTAEEREKGIYEMTKDGAVTHGDVAAMLGKNEQYVWRHISAHKIRELTDKAGADTSGISTNTLCEIASAADGDIPLLIERIKEEGGTLAAARRIGREYRGVDAPEESEAAPQPEEETEFSDFPEPSRERPLCPAGVVPPRELSASARPAEKHIPRETTTLADFDPPHKQVDVNDVLAIINSYIDEMKKKFYDSNEDDCFEFHDKMDAAWDIVALLHERL
jgi:ParB/RepB/Spo0J family partition protein